MRIVTFVVLVSLYVSTALALSPREELIGAWYFKRGIGNPCDRLITALEYHFEKSGAYSTWARMRDGGEYRYTGTYNATDTTTTATVNGQKIGPYPYRINNDVLRITQPENHCVVELTRE